MTPHVIELGGYLPPGGFEKKVKGIFVTFRSVVTWVWWLVFEEAGGAGWFLSKHGVLAGF